jgi:hypothetical protein
MYEGSRISTCDCWERRETYLERATQRTMKIAELTLAYRSFYSLVVLCCICMKHLDERGGGWKEKRSGCVVGCDLLVFWTLT